MILSTTLEQGKALPKAHSSVSGCKCGLKWNVSLINIKPKVCAKHFLLRLFWILHYWVIFYGFWALKSSFFNYSFPLNLNVQDTIYPVFTSYGFWGKIQKWSMASLRPWEIESIDLPLPCAKRLWFLDLLNLKSWHQIKAMREMSSERTVLVLSDKPARAFFSPHSGLCGDKGLVGTGTLWMPCSAWGWNRAWREGTEGAAGSQDIVCRGSRRRAVWSPSFSFQVPQGLQCWNLRWTFLGQAPPSLSPYWRGNKNLK